MVQILGVGSQYNQDELVAFVNNHPDVLFVIDQANLYFSTPIFSESNSIFQDDFMFNSLTYYRKEPTTRRFKDESLILVTNTTTKAFGISGCAVVAGTPLIQEILVKNLENASPELFFDNTDLMSQGKAALYLENQFFPASYDEKKHDARESFDFRNAIMRNKDVLRSRLKELFGDQVNCPELIVEGARIIINAKEAGFDSAKNLCDWFYHECSIATKPATVYASPKVESEWDKYVQVTAPWNEEMLNANLQAFEKLYQRLHVMIK